MKEVQFETHMCKNLEYDMVSGINKQFFLSYHEALFIEILMDFEIWSHP